MEPPGRVSGRFQPSPRRVMRPTALPCAQVVEGPRGNCAVEVDFQGETQVFSMEKVAAMVLVEMKKIAEADQGSEITDCVLACPVYATDAERAAMVDAARIAGLTPLRIVNENTATALGYGIYKTDLPEDKPVHVAIVDYGHVGIQVSVVALTRTGLRVLAHSWDVSCGGRALDWALFEMARGEFRAKTKLDVLENKRATLRLLLAVEKCKKARPPSALRAPNADEPPPAAPPTRTIHVTSLAGPHFEPPGAPLGRVPDGGPGLQHHGGAGAV